jgi:hypothetical protein
MKNSVSPGPDRSTSQDTESSNVHDRTGQVPSVHMQRQSDAVGQILDAVDGVRLERDDLSTGEDMLDNRLQLAVVAGRVGAAPQDVLRLLAQTHAR